MVPSTLISDKLIALAGSPTARVRCYTYTTCERPLCPRAGVGVWSLTACQKRELSALLSGRLSRREESKR